MRMIVTSGNSNGPLDGFESSNCGRVSDERSAMQQDRDVAFESAKKKWKQGSLQWTHAVFSFRRMAEYQLTGPNPQ